MKTKIYLVWVKTEDFMCVTAVFTSKEKAEAFKKEGTELFENKTYWIQEEILDRFANCY